MANPFTEIFSTRRPARAGSLMNVLGAPSYQEVQLAADERARQQAQLERQQAFEEKRRTASIAAAQLVLQNPDASEESVSGARDILRKNGLEALIGGFRKQPAKKERTTKVVGTTLLEIPEEGPVKTLFSDSPDPTVSERARSKLVDLRVRKQRGETLSPTDEQMLSILEAEFAKATTITGRTPEDVAVKDPVRRRRLQTSIEAGAQAQREIMSVIEGIKLTPEAVGGIAAGREALGGIVGQVGDILESNFVNEVADKISPDELTALRASAGALQVSLLPIMTQEPSRYSDAERAEVRRQLKVLSNAANSRQAIVSLQTMAAIFQRRDAADRRELKEGFGETYLGNQDIDRGAGATPTRLIPGAIFTDAQGNRAEYLGVNPNNPRDPKNWREVK